MTAIVRVTSIQAARRDGLADSGMLAMRLPVGHVKRVPQSRARRSHEIRGKRAYFLGYRAAIIDLLREPLP